MKTIDDKDFSLLDFLPDSIAKDENVNASARAIDPHLRELGTFVDMGMIYKNIDKLSSVALDHLAVSFDVRPWRDSWSVDLKRSAIRANITTKRQKGTLAAVKAALAGLGARSRVVEWCKQDPPGTPGTFKIYVTLSVGSNVVPAEMQEDIQAAINEAKPYSRHYDFILQQALAGGVGVYGCVRTATLTRLNFTAVLPD